MAQSPWVAGVLFMAILIAVLLKNYRLAEQPAPPIAATSAAEAATARVELRQLEAAVQAQRQVRSDVAARQMEMAAALEALEHWQARRQSAQTERDRRRRETSTERAQLDRQHSAHASLDERLKAAEADLGLMRARLAEERHSRTRLATLPRERSTLRSERGVVLRYGRLYVWHTFDADGEQKGLNTEDMVVRDRVDGHLEVTPKPYAGVPLGDTPGAIAALRTKLAPFDSDRDYLAVIEWDDSFEDFQRMRSELVEDGWEYRLMLGGPGSEIVDRGGSGGKVQ